MLADHASDICAIITLVTLVVKPIREKLFGNEKVREGQRCLLRAEIVRTYYRNLEKKTLREYEYENLVHCYEAYKRLGGNSFIDHIYQEMNTWAIVP